eukprot:7530951-Pyramimonas_sp.AAC.1
MPTVAGRSACMVTRPASSICMAKLLYRTWSLTREGSLCGRIGALAEVELPEDSGRKVVEHTPP